MDQGYVRLFILLDSISNQLKLPWFTTITANNCMSKVNDLSSKECKNCRYDLLDEKRGCFIEFPIVYQLTTLFKKQNFYRDIQYRFSRKMSQKQYLRYL